MLEKFEQYKIKKPRVICGGQDAIPPTHKPPKPPVGI